MVRTRFAPSPTGFLHVGHLRTALYSYAYARSKGGQFVLRIEDTDRRRFVPGATEKIYQILKVFGLNWDELYVQSERVKTGIYKKYAEQLVKDGYAYYCFCPPETLTEIEKRHQQREIRLRDECRDLTLQKARAKIKAGEIPAIRLRVPDREKVSFYDFVLKKEISWQTKCIDEVMLLKSDGFPTYHLAVTVDDALMKITHIIRGPEWLSSTPIHLLIFKYLGFKIPQIGHLTAILDPAGGKLSKRKGAVACEEFIAEGYLPEAILNFVILLGWAPKNNREIFSLADFVKEFSNGTLQTANPVFNRKKLDWFNGWYIRQMADKKLLQLIKPFIPTGMSATLVAKTLPLVKERVIKLSDYTGLTEFLVKEPKIDNELFCAKCGDEKTVKKWLVLASKKLGKVMPWKTRSLEKTLRDLAQKQDLHVGKFFMAIRIAITGKTATPPLFESMELLGKEKTLKRISLTQASI